ncbi:hypothetical protein GBAR_LOCUS8486 [Geodia barretti]|uniref:Uncharacterized protein n=1 Tax=Geodia barretti TaxID=519541 RepID=A0AA35WDL4_GEOBA|nr:hypothetical protein GBAR_LOCUS8486 [Geodia barretti]
MADNGERPEITALRTNLTSITDTVTVGDNLQWFSNCLVEKAFIARRTARAILGGGATPAHKAGQLIDGVFAVILPSDRKSHWFAEFVSIFSTDPAYAELVEKLKRHVVQTNQQQLQSPIPASPSASSSLHVPASSGTTPATSSEESPAPSSTTTSSLPPVPPPPSPNHPSAPSFWTVEKVKSTIQEFRKTFSKLHADVVIEMSNKESENKAILEELRSHLLLLPVRKATLHVKFFDKNEKDIIEAKDARMIMAIPCRYVDYRNNEILLHIVIAFCEEELQKRMKNFCELLEEFEIATTIDVYKKAIPNEVDEEVMNGFSNMIVKIDKPESQYTLHEVRKLNKAIIVKSTLCSHSIYIGAVSRNCVVVRLRFPSSAVGWVLAAITPDFMTTHLLTEVTVDGHQLSLIQAQRYELNNELIIAGRAGQVIRAASLLNSGADIQTKDQVFWTPLKWASRNGHLQVVRLLISREAQLNHQDEVGNSTTCAHVWVSMSKSHG